MSAIITAKALATVALWSAGALGLYALVNGGLGPAKQVESSKSKRNKEVKVERGNGSQSTGGAGSSTAITARAG